MKIIPIIKNRPCWCGSGNVYSSCHAEFDRRIQEFKKMGAKVPNHKMIKTPAQIEGIKASAKINIAVLDYVAEHIREGISTQEIDDWVYKLTTDMGGIPAPLNYEGFPKSVCTSLNNVVCHGIPTKDELLMYDDIINVDCSTIYNGYYSDSSRMFMIGNVSQEDQKLVRVAKECVAEGLKQVRPWGFLGDMGEAVHNHAKANGYTVVKDIGGHGCGIKFHEEPWVSYVTKKGTEMLMVPGMCFTIEPMINAGTDEFFIDEDNGWTVYTDDDKNSAQWEVQVLVTETGFEIISY